LAAQREPRRKKLRTREHVIADLSINHVERHILRCGFSVERVQHDYGTDLLMFTYSDTGEIENGHVQYQLKATERLDWHRDGETFPFRVEFADLKHWMYEPLPVILIVYEAARDRAFWLYLQRALDVQWRPDGLQERVTLHIPGRNRLNQSAVRRIRRFRDQILRQIEGAIRHDGP
jgi:Domain of unknown function (DUF4365)